MKTLVFLFGSLQDYSCQPLSGDGVSYSALERAARAALQFPNVENVVLCAPSLPDGAAVPPGVTPVLCPEWTKQALLAAAAEQSAGYDHVYFAPADAPFLNVDAAVRLMELHTTYAAEYTFADGYPVGLFPEIAAQGIVPMLATLASKSTAPERVTRDTIFSVLQKDINSFDIETDIAPVDMRQLRLEFLCNTKRNSLLCSRFLEAGIVLTPENVSTEVDSHLPFIRTLPSFYAIQTTAACPHRCSICPYPQSPLATTARNITVDEFTLLTRKIADFSGDAVISLSLWGEPALHNDTPAFVRAILAEPALSVLIETTGCGWKQETLDAIYENVKTAAPRTNGHQPVEWIVSLDAISTEYYAPVHGNASVDEAMAFTDTLLKRFPGCVWPQMVRTLDNEPHLEQFYRYWKEKAGCVLIQKYDYFCEQLPQKKTADLSPIARNVCWHLKRDMVILSDGRVPMCHECLDGTSSCGNALTEDLADIWAVNESLYMKHCTGQYTGLCGTCDEYYTFNF